MAKITGIFAIGVILLFLGLAVNPATAQTTSENQLELGTIDDLESVDLSEQDLASMEKILPVLLEKIHTASSYAALIEIIKNIMTDHGRHPVLVLMLKLLIKSIEFNFKLGQWLPVRKNAFVISWGFTNKLLSYRSLGMQMIRPITAWYYSGQSNVLLNSRTIILDPYPFSVKMIDGRQIGFMRDFIGFYVHRSGPNAQNALTCFIGYARVVRGFDLSPISDFSPLCK